jgi:hypothetical protein
MDMDGDLIVQLMNDMDPRLLQLLRGAVNSFIKWDLLRFFYANPHTMDTADSLARYIGREPGGLPAELQELVDSGLLEAQHLGKLTVYSLSGSTEQRMLLDDFMAACQDQQFRVKAIYHVIRGMRHGQG